MTQSQEQQCKGCGLMVQAGYARCPRCTMPQPARSGRASTQMSGGTAAEESGTRVTLIAGGALIAVVILLLVVKGGGEEKAPAPAPQDEVELTDSEAPVAPPTQTPTTPADREVGFAGVERASDPAEVRQAALSQLTKALSQKRLWATVSADRGTPSLLIVVSANCKESGMIPAISDASASLLQVGFESVRCVEKHGALVFEQAL